MRSAPTQEYHNNPRPRKGLAASPGYIDTSLLEATGDRELPDATLTQAQKRLLKEQVRATAPHLSSHELMFLAGAFEFAANWTRAQQEHLAT